MSNPEEIKKAKEHINGLLQLGNEIQKSTSFLNYINQNLDWFLNVHNALPEKQNELMNTIEGPLSVIRSIDYSTFNLSFASGSTAMFVTASTEASAVIESCDKEYRYLLKQLSEINPTEKLTEDILQLLPKFNADIANEFADVKQSYSEWKANLRTSSDLAKDTRTFKEHFDGLINKLRVPKNEWGIKKIPSMSWKKIVEAIGKKHPEHRNSFMRQQKNGEGIWEIMTQVLKKTTDISNQEMELLFKRYLDHLFAVINLIDENKIS